MDRGVAALWLGVGTLLAASTFMGVRIEQRRAEARRASATVETGDLVSLASVVDGDSVVVTNADGSPVVVRVLGIKSLDGSGKDALAVHGQAAQSALREKLAEKPIRVLVGSPPKDKHGRTLATLFVDDVDVGLALVREGKVLVYTPAPFPDMQRYLEVQAEAHADRRGLWADPAAAARADGLLASWRKQ